MSAGGSAAPRPRVLVLSSRGIDSSLWHAPQYEFEDVIAEVDSVRLVAPPPPPRSELRDYLREGVQLAWKSALALRGRSPADRSPPVAEGEIDGDYDLFFAVFHFPQDLDQLRSIRGWRARCRKAICYVIELWTADFPDYDRYLALLADFDTVYVFNPAVVEPVARIAGRRPEYLALGVDTLRFSPYPEPVERTIDVLAYGRRSPEAHRQLAAMAERRELFYVHDTIRQSPMVDYRQHRVLLASYARRSRYAMAYRINEDRLVRTGGDEGLTARLFEITAAGAVMLGTPPRCAEFERYFGWPDAMIEIPWAEPDMAAVLADLDAQPERMAAIGRRNAVNGLLRHDWVYRWGQVLEAAGLPPLPAFDARVARLRTLAEAADATEATEAALAGTPR